MEIFHKTKPDGLNARQVLLFSKSDPNIVGNAFFSTNIDLFVFYNPQGELVDFIIQQPILMNGRE